MKGNALGPQFLVRKRTVPVVKMIEFVGDRMYLIIRDDWCYIIVLNVYVLTKDATVDTVI
jgi:hypothetical protein